MSPSHKPNPPSSPTQPHEFEQVLAQTYSDIVLYQKRAESQIRCVPKVIILEKGTDWLTVAVQNPPCLLMNWLRGQDQTTRVKGVETVVNCFSELAWVYGHFYIDREMMRVTGDGEPVIWIHHNFLMNLREFPIQTSKMSEAIFVHKLRATLSEVLFFPEKTQTDTIVQLKELIQSFKKLIPRPISQLVSPRTPKKAERPIHKDSSESPTRKPNKSNTKGLRQLPSLPLLGMNRVSSTTNFYRGKNTGNLEKYRQQNPPISRNEKHERLNTELETARNLQPCPQEWNPERKQRDKFFPSRSPESKPSIKAEEKPPGDESPEAKNRKLSADYALLQNWINSSGKALEKNFAGTSFSTRVTFSSKGENEANPNEIDDAQHRKGGRLIFSIQATDQFGNRQRLSANLKRILRESGIRISRISEEGSIEMEFDSLFGDGQLTERNPLKESELKKELETLFQSESLEMKEIPEQEEELINEIASLLD